MSTTYEIPTLVEGDGLSKLNESITQTNNALNAISARVDNVNTKQALIRYNVPIAEDVDAGSLVYFRIPDTDQGVAVYARALAKLEPIPGEQGESIEAACARVEGMIIAKDTATMTGTLLIGGYWESVSCATACLGATAKAGTYYLSPTAAGKATLSPSIHLRQPVLSYYGNGKFSLTLFYMAHDNHFHTSATTSVQWMTADQLATLKSITKPTGAKWGYDHTSDPEFKSLGVMTNDIVAVFKNGVLQTGTDSFTVSDGFLWSKEDTVPAVGDITVFNHFPFAYGSPVIRSIESGSDLLSVSTVNGTCRLKAFEFTSGSTAKQALAVAALSGNTILFTPVISGLYAGPGISITGNSDGSAVVATSDLIGTQLDAYSINNNGTTITSDSLFTYLTYPSKRSSAAVITLPIRDVGKNTVMNAVVWAIGTDTGALFNVKMYYLPTPTIGGTTTKPGPSSTPDVTTTLSTVSTTGFSYSESADKLKTIDKDGLLVAIVSIASTPSTDIKLLRIGFKLGIESSTEEQGSGVVPTSTNAVKMEGIAGEAIPKYSAVYAGTDGKIRRCISTQKSLTGACIGVALEAVSADDTLTYMITGIIQDPDFVTSLGYAPAPGHAVYVGETGVLTQTDPQTSATAKFSQRLGTALTGSVIQINLGTAIELDV